MIENIRHGLNIRKGSNEMTTIEFADFMNEVRKGAEELKQQKEYFPFGNKQELADNETEFIILSLELKETRTEGQMWFMAIQHTGDVKEMITFRRSNKRDEIFNVLKEYVEKQPVHGAMLEKISFKTGSGERRSYYSLVSVSSNR